MEEKIYFSDSYGKPISEQDSMNKFHKAYEENGVIRKIEAYEVNVLMDIEYFLDDNENTDTVLAKLTELVKRFVTLGRRKEYGKYTIVKSSQFSKGKVLFKACELVDENNNVICIQVLDWKTEEPILESTEKYIIDDKGYDIAFFNYNDEGKFKSLTGSIVSELSVFIREPLYEIEEVNKYLPNLFQEYPYYRNATFLPEILTL